MSERPLLPLLQAHDRALWAAAMPPGAKHRIAAHLAAHAERRREVAARRWIPMVTFAAGAALVMLVGGWKLLRGGGDAPEPAATVASASLAGFRLEGEHCQGRREGEVAVLAGDCRLVGPQLVVQTWDQTRLVPSTRTVVLSSGHAMFDVQKVEPGQQPVRVVVSHGVIEVLGTRFTVDQSEGGGTVDLFEGHIRFRDARQGRRVVDIQPGERYAWGDRAAADVNAAGPVDVPAVDVPAVDMPVRTAPTRRPQEARPRDVSALIERVTQLRGAGRYRQAAAVLRQALSQRWDRRTAQVLSYELGQLLQRHLGEAEAACAHWRQHRAKYPEGRYTDAVTAALGTCDANESEP